MKTFFYPRLAADSIRKNKRMYVPYILSGMLTVAMFYIMSFLSKSRLVSEMEGGSGTQQILSLGSVVLAFFSVIFLFYTNSFLIKRRKKEYGLYNVLGMSKRNLGRILLFETLIIYAAALVGGLAIGICFSKLAEMVLLRLVAGVADYRFSIIPGAIIFTTVLFSVIYFLILLNSLRQIWFMDPAQLVKSDKEGEKPPKGNWLLGIAGIVLLGAAYYIAISIRQPLAALVLFLVAVIMVMIATYIIFITGSVLVCRILKKNKGYYYRKNHFISVSSMTYRMKRNGAGLASICILLTGVLVMISSTASLYISADSCIENRYPKDMNAFAAFDGYNEQNAARAAELEEMIRGIMDDGEIISGSEEVYYEYSVTGLADLGGINIDADPEANILTTNYDKITDVHFIDLAEYNRLHGKQEELSEGEAIISAVKMKNITDTLQIGELTFRVKKQLRRRI